MLRPYRSSDGLSPTVVNVSLTGVGFNPTGFKFNSRGVGFNPTAVDARSRGVGFAPTPEIYSAFGSALSWSMVSKAWRRCGMTMLPPTTSATFRASYSSSLFQPASTHWSRW
jgi:hypothetical protein